MSFYNQPAASCRFPCGLLTEFQSSDLEIDSNGRNESRIERVFGETKYYARLPNPAVAYEKKLEKQVKIRLRHFESLFPICAVLRDGQDVAYRGEWGVVPEVHEPEPEMAHALTRLNKQN